MSNMHYAKRHFRDQIARYVELGQLLKKLPKHLHAEVLGTDHATEKSGIYREVADACYDHADFDDATWESLFEDYWHGVYLWLRSTDTSLKPSKRYRAGRLAMSTPMRKASIMTLANREEKP